jgi:hypothetical protein
LAISPARCDLGHEANPKNPKSMKEPPGLTVRSGSELSSPCRPKRLYGCGGGDNGKAERSQNRLSAWGCPPGAPLVGTPGMVPSLSTQQPPPCWWANRRAGSTSGSIWTLFWSRELRLEPRDCAGVLIPNRSTGVILKFTFVFKSRFCSYEQLWF